MRDRNAENLRKPHAMAIRIYLENDRQPMAEIALINGEHRIIRWDDPLQREQYFFDAYTLFYDEREKSDWSRW